MTAAGVRRAALARRAQAVSFQGHVLLLGDFLATWVTELAVHQLDLARELDLSASRGAGPRAGEVAARLPSLA